MRLGFTSLLFLILLTLKLCGIITISWFWLLTILCAPLVLIIMIVVGGILLS